MRKSKPSTKSKSQFAPIPVRERLEETRASYDRVTKKVKPADLTDRPKATSQTIATDMCFGTTNRKGGK